MAIQGNTAAGSVDEAVATVQGTDILPATSRGQDFLSMILNVFNMMVIIFILSCSCYDPAIANQAQGFVFFVCLFGQISFYYHPSSFYLILSHK